MLSVTPLEKQDISEAAFVVADAFLDNPADHIKAVWKGPHSTMLQRNTKLFELLFKGEGKTVYVVKKDNKIVGVYGCHHSDYCHMSLVQQAKIAIPLLIAVKTSFPRILHFHDQWGAVDPDEQHLHLSPACVKPGEQGQGIGKLMMKHFCELLDQQQIGGYLETGKWENVLFYQQFGFETRQEVSIYDARTWTMWRDPEAV